ncbi:uncharacterized protein B0H18DRAFT_368603 [Fomitopsis serialis]|uniref:uncharacterized protein n=1 Tax=Fomitopsis serialis TaxID=139415 RepID=UPI0020074250|nr:uncharacterized protein B0H18DRAFT_368603 [Neoantrodia serialis]KAH9925811.1 hypothetical protein B0H18DRAFT_368603 [Neoantrodia serialis]
MCRCGGGLPFMNCSRFSHIWLSFALSTTFVAVCRALILSLDRRRPHLAPGGDDDHLTRSKHVRPTYIQHVASFVLIFSNGDQVARRDSLSSGVLFLGSWLPSELTSGGLPVPSMSQVSASEGVICMNQ